MIDIELRAVDACSSLPITTFLNAQLGEVEEWFMKRMIFPYSKALTSVLLQGFESMDSGDDKKYEH